MQSAPPLKPVRAPSGVTGILYLFANFIISEISLAFAGFTNTDGGKT